MAFFLEQYYMYFSNSIIGHFTVMDGSEAEGDLVLIQTGLEINFFVREPAGD